MKNLIIIILFVLSPALLFAEETEQGSAAVSEEADLEKGAPTADPSMEEKPAVATDEAAAEEKQDITSDPATIAKLNEVIKTIYDAAIAGKDKFREMASFDETCLTKNKYGIYQIDYVMPIPEGAKNVWPFAFGVTIDKPGDATFVDKIGYFKYPLPFLGYQLSSYVVKHPFRRQFDAPGFLDKAATELADYQQQFLPLHLIIVPEKDEYKVHEPIAFKLILANVSKHNILVKDLSDKSLFFSINDTFWGTKAGDVKETKPLTRVEAMRMQQQARAAEIRARFGRTPPKPIERERKTRIGDQVILRSEEALTLDFTGDGYKRAQDVKIRGIYQLNFQGLKPTASAALKIVD